MQFRDRLCPLFKCLISENIFEKHDTFIWWWYSDVHWCNFFILKLNDTSDHDIMIPRYHYIIMMHDGSEWCSGLRRSAHNSVILSKTPHPPQLRSGFPDENKYEEDMIRFYTESSRRGYFTTFSLYLMSSTTPTPYPRRSQWLLLGAPDCGDTCD